MARCRDGQQPDRVPESARGVAGTGATGYAWRFRAQPSGSNALIDGADEQRAEFEPDVAGTYVVHARRLLAGMLRRALSGGSRAEVLFADAGFEGAPSIAAISRGEYRRKSIADIRGSGYVVESLEAALWCFYSTEAFREAVLRAANLGDDADTTAAVCGQVAGAYCGRVGIPANWLNMLAKRNEITRLADVLYEVQNSPAWKVSRKQRQNHTGQYAPREPAAFFGLPRVMALRM